MKILFILITFIFLSFSIVYADPGTTAAVLSQTAKQTGEHLQQLTKTIETIKQLERQIEETKRLKELAERAADGIENVQSISDFRNLVLEADSLRKQLDRYIDHTKNISEEWKGVFGSLDEKSLDSKDKLQNINVSDEVNSGGYSVADSYQGEYNRNAEQAQALIDNSKLVNEKGAMKQTAESLGHLLQMQNHVVFLLSQQVKEQSIENANQNFERKNEVLQLQQENERVHNFVHIVDSNTFGL